MVEAAGWKMPHPKVYEYVHEYIFARAVMAWFHYSSEDMLKSIKERVVQFHQRNDAREGPGGPTMDTCLGPLDEYVDRG